MTWREALERSIRSVGQLTAAVDLTPNEVAKLSAAAERHPMSITPYYLSLIDWSDPSDPIRKMAVPSGDELSPIGSYDTSGESENTKLPGLQHKYGPTALVLTTNRCAVYCRHCFRKRLVGLPSAEILQRFEDAALYIESHTEITNVLLSGGDPFVLPTAMLGAFLKRLDAIEHLRFIRFGTRIPVVLPERIIEDEQLLDLVRRHSRKDRRIYVVTQFNHPREITALADRAVERLLEAGAIVGNQTVLLRGVNDDPGVLSELQGRLAGIGATPYYVFQCRPVKRVKAGFQVSLRRGYGIVEQAKAELSGIAKRFKFVMSHRTGKIEIVGLSGDVMSFRYHEAKRTEDAGRFFRKRLAPGAGWLDDVSGGVVIDRPPEGTGLPIS